MSGGEDHTTARWLVSGQVQGVGFRWFTKRRADELGLVGWARNLPNGDVEVLARGPRVAIDALDEYLRRGPSMARVKGVEKSHLPHQPVDYKSFDIN